MPQNFSNPDANGLEHPIYLDPSIPILRLEHHLGDYPSGMVPTHWHSEFLFGLVLQGRVAYVYHQDAAHPVEYELEEGEGVFINSRVMHGCRQLTPGARVFVFGMLPSVMATPLLGALYQKKILPLIDSKVMGVQFSSQREEDRPLLELFQRYYGLTPGSEDYELRGAALLCEIWATLFHTLEDTSRLWMHQDFDPASAELVRPMIQYIVANFTEPITVDQIAQAGGTSRRECYRRFRTILGQTPLEFLIRHRLTVAFYQLSTTSRPVSRVSEDCGFPSASYFTKQFKKLFGVSPGQVSKRHEGNRCGIPYDPWYLAQVYASSDADSHTDDGA